MTRCAFNVFNFDSMEALGRAVNITGLPVFMQVSVSTAKYLDPSAIFKFYERMENRSKIQLHLDHCDSIDFIKSCVDVGWRSIMADFSNCQIRDNINFLNKVRSYLPASDGIIEGEVGSIGGEEDGYAATSDAKAKLEDVSQILKNTDIDLLAVGIGNKHGHYVDNSKVDFEHFKVISNLFPKAKLVLHGGSGLPEDKVLDLKSFGLEKINISTDLKDKYINSLTKLINSKQKYNMIQYSKLPQQEMTDFFVQKMEIFK